MSSSATPGWRRWRSDKVERPPGWSTCFPSRRRTGVKDLITPTSSSSPITVELSAKEVVLSLGGSQYDPTDQAGRLLVTVLNMVVEFDPI